MCPTTWKSDGGFESWSPCDIHTYEKNTSQQQKSEIVYLLRISDETSSEEGWDNVSWPSSYLHLIPQSFKQSLDFTVTEFVDLDHREPIFAVVALGDLTSKIPCDLLYTGVVRKMALATRYLL